jgi:hypothetical protein
MPDLQDRPWTPGPWRIEAPHGYAHDVVSADNNYIICGFGPAEYSDSTNDANARLIAAAPELYEALEFVFEHIADKERGPRDLYPAFGLDARRAIEMTRAALAKARGEP